MEIGDLINENLICLDLDLKDKTEVIKHLASLAAKEGKLVKKEENAEDGYVQAVLDREKVFSTAVGYSFGIPHGKCKYVEDACLSFARLKEEIEWGDEEDEKVKNVFMIGVSEEKAGNEHLEILIKLSTSILDDEFREKLENATEKSEILEIIKEYTSKERN